MLYTVKLAFLVEMRLAVDHWFLQQVGKCIVFFFEYYITFYLIIIPYFFFK